jgi:hypothetical protein
MIEVGGLNDVRIMYHSSADNVPLAVTPDKWPSLQDSGEIADGVLLFQGEKHLVISPMTNRRGEWALTPINGGGTLTSDRLTAMSDWNGKTNTASQVTNDACSDTRFVPGFCIAYSNGGLEAGKWWLPSLGELIFIFAHKAEINYALGLISGAELIGEYNYWSSTESSKSGAWYLNMGDGNINSALKPNYTYRCLPVSAFIA